MRPAKLTLTLSALLLLAIAAPMNAQQTPAPAPAAPAPNPADVASVDAIVAALYDVISGPAGQARDWDRFRSLFHPSARLIPAGKNRQGVVAARHLVEPVAHGGEEVGVGVEDRPVHRELDHRQRLVERGERRLKVAAARPSRPTACAEAGLRGPEHAEHPEVAFPDVTLGKVPENSL